MLKIPKTICDQMLSHARAVYPNECCGLLAGEKGRPSVQYRMANADPNPTVRYFMDPKQQFAVFKEMREKGLELTAIYHSHPMTEAYPSQTDIHLAYYPDAIYIILSLANRAAPVMKAFRIQKGNVTPVPIEIAP
jgi:proteasome lid subunit RPN8/RPN11